MPDQLSPAISEETFAVQAPAVVSPDNDNRDPNAPIAFRFCVGQIGPDLYLKAYIANMDADTAIQVGEYLAREGRRVKTGLILAQPAAPADLKP